MPDSSPASTDAIDALIQRCLAGDQQAWEEIVRQHRRKVFNIAYKFTGKHDEAEDLTQDIFLKIFRSLHTFDRRANFQTWLVSVSIVSGVSAGIGRLPQGGGNVEDDSR